MAYRREFCRHGHKIVTSKSGKRVCAECNRLYGALWRQRHGVTARYPHRELCKRGHKITVTKTGKRRCRECARLNHLKWQANNREHIREYFREYDRKYKP